MPESRWGATKDEWNLFDLELTLTEDLLPVVSNPTAAISAGSTLKSLGKTPSRYNRKGEAAGLKDWTGRKTSGEAIAKWSGVPDYGMCLQTRRVRAIDIDDGEQAEAIAAFIYERLTPPGLRLPERYRENSNKTLLAFRMDGVFPKRAIPTAHGQIEFLGNGQQFVAAGTHTSGARYRWRWHGAADFPTLDPDTFETLWQALIDRFAVAKAHEGKERVKGESFACDDPRVPLIETHPSFLHAGNEGQLFFECPWKAEHTGESGPSETAYFPAGTGGHNAGHYKCMHAHCADRGDGAFDQALDLYAGDFDCADGADESVAEAKQDGNAPRFPLIEARDYIRRPPPGWFIKGILPVGELAMLYGESGAGKSFVMLDMLMALARGVDWNGHKVRRKHRVVYIVAEDRGGVVGRLQAYAQGAGDANSLLDDVDFQIIDRTPNLLDSGDVLDVARSIRADGRGPADIIAIDTFAQTTAGGNENEAKDMSKALANCQHLRTATGAMPFLVHHAGKNIDLGARGWSGIKAACDAEMEITREDERRFLRVSKQKNAMDGERWGFRLVPVVVGFDDDGDEVSSCRVEFTGRANRTEKIAPRVKQKPRGEWQERTAIVFGELNNLGGGVAYETLLEAVVDKVPSLKKSERWRFKEYAIRAIARMIDMGYFSSEDGVISLK